MRNLKAKKSKFQKKPTFAQVLLAETFNDTYKENKKNDITRAKIMPITKVITKSLKKSPL